MVSILYVVLSYLHRESEYGRRIANLRERGKNLVHLYSTITI